MARRIGGAGGGSDPGSGKAAGIVAATVLAGLVAVGGLGSGAVSLSGSSGGASLDSVARHDLTSKKTEGKKSARKGNADEAWRRLNMRTLKKTMKRDRQCVVHSFGKVREFFVSNPCKSLDRVLYGIGDGEGNTVVVSVVWVSFRARGDARAFQDLNDVHGIGDVTPLASTLLNLADIKFTGHHYQSRLDRDTVVIAETEAGTGQISAEVLDAVAEVAVWLPKP